MRDSEVTVENIPTEKSKFEPVRVIMDIYSEEEFVAVYARFVMSDYIIEKMLKQTDMAYLAPYLRNFESDAISSAHLKLAQIGTDMDVFDEDGFPTIETPEE